MIAAPTMVNNEDSTRNPPYLVTQSRTTIPVLGRITGSNINYEILKEKIVIGRNSAQGRVDLHINLSSYISRKHVLISYECNQFFLVCLGKNGIFVDGSFQRSHASPYPLKERCIIRFPSTTIRLTFDPAVPPVLLPPTSSAAPAILPPPRQGNEEEDEDKNDNLQIDLQQTPMRRPMPTFSNVPRRYISAPPSPTGTISAVSSCPGSPRSSRLHRGHNDVSRDLEQAASVIAANCQQFDDPETQSGLKPPYSYAQLIVQAICSAPQQQLTLSGIYAHITKHYPFYRSSDKGWQNSIRHNLSLNRYFLKVPRSQEESGKGSFWRIDPDSEKKLTDTAWKKRRTQPRTSNPSQNAAFARSLPGSPDRSGKSSPLEIMQGSNDSMPSTSGVSSQPASSAARASSMMVEYKTPVDSFHRSNRYAQSAPGSPSTGNPRGAAFNVPESKVYHQTQNNQAAAFRHTTVVYHQPTTTTTTQQPSAVGNETSQHHTYVTQPRAYEAHYASAPTQQQAGISPPAPTHATVQLPVSSLAAGVAVGNQIKVPFNPQTLPRPTVIKTTTLTPNTGPISIIPAQRVEQAFVASSATAQGDKPAAVFVSTTNAGQKRPYPVSGDAHQEPSSKVQNNGGGSQPNSSSS